jgi:hypothetical protein
MANEFQHKDPGTALTQAEYITTDGTGHIFDCQATGDIMYASSATVLKNLGKGAANTILSMGGSCIPAWTASPSVTDLTIGGGCITLSAATDIDLLDNNASALSFDASGKTGIIDIVTTNCSEGVTMSGTLGVTGVLTATGGLAGGAIDIGASTITTTGLISGGSLDIDNVLINGTTIGHTCDSDLVTVADACLTIKGAVTVGVDDAGHDVKFFGAAAGAYMLYDFSCDQLEIRGASADAATSTGKLLLSTALTNINACDVIGSINFQAPAEAGGTDAVAIAAGIRAVAQATFTCAVNATDLIFYTGHSEAATEKFRFTSQGEIGIGGATYGTDGHVLTSGGPGAAVAWEALPSSGPTEADQSEMEGECSGTLYVPPDLLVYHPGVAKAWVIWRHSTTIDADYNVASVTYNCSAGSYDITIDTAHDFSSANYAVVGGGGDDDRDIKIRTAGTPTTEVIPVQYNVDSNASAANVSTTALHGASIAIFGDFA